MQDTTSTNSLAIPATNDACPSSGIGPNFDPLSEQYLTNPYAFFAQARQAEPVFFSPLLNAWVVSRYDDVKAILHDPKRFSSVGNSVPVGDLVPAAQAILEQGPYKHALACSLISADPPQHTRLRASLTKTFSAQRLARYEPLVHGIASQLIDQFRDEGQVDVVERFNYPFPLLVIFKLIGVPEADMEQVHTWCLDWNTLNFSRPSAESQVECAHSAVAFQRYMDALIERRSAIPQNDFLSDLLAAIADGEAHLSREELFAQVFLLILAGHETTASFLGNCLLYLLGQHSLWWLLCEDPKVISGVVEEALRMEGPVLGLFRVTTEAVEIGGVSLPAGGRVLILYGSANHDETQFPDPEAFLLQRPNQTRHMGLGNGIHFCLGAPLARMEARIALELLSSRLPGVHLVPDQELNYKPSVSGRSLTRLLIEWDVRYAPQTRLLFPVLENMPEQEREGGDLRSCTEFIILQ